MPRKKKGDLVHGWIVIDKPIGMNSTPVVSLLRRLLNAQKAGHGGTLDPLASGVLPIAFGEATKTVGLVMDGIKEYDFTATWGAQTSSDDSDGEVTERSDLRPELDRLKAVIADFCGTISQLPPAVSALKIDGQRAYDLARQGKEVTLAPRQIEIYSLELIAARQDSADFRVSCSKGTYVRALARDIARACGTLGHVSALRRTRVGSFSLEDAILLDDLKKIDDIERRFEHLLSLESALDDIPALDIDLNEANCIAQGQTISLLSRFQSARLDHLDFDAPFWLRLNGNAVALAQIYDGSIRSTRVFNHWI